MPSSLSSLWSRRTVTFGAIMLTLVLAAGAQTPTLKLLHNFGVTPGDGNIPSGPPLKDTAGNFYGVTSVGGAHNLGTVYRLSPTSTGDFTETILYSFKGGSTDGSLPQGPLFRDNAGNLYGTTLEGGITATVCGPTIPSPGCGIVFKLTPTTTGTWTETVLHRFTGTDGGNPYSGLVQDSKGNFYGATPVGGSKGLGTVYKLSHTSTGWKETVIHSFIGGTDGAQPYLNEMTLALDSLGNLYGSTYRGGAANAGIVFELIPQTTGVFTEKVLYTFKGGSDGSQPFTGVTLDKSGNVYGGTLRGGTNIGSGTVFKLTAANGYAKTVLHNFSISDPAIDLPNTPFLDANGNLWGTTEYALFELSPGSTGWSESVLWVWDHSETLYAPPIMDAEGHFYGTTLSGQVWEVIP
jgi:uncharacterized repeat protein (TIGR03803 family)